MTAVPQATVTVTVKNAAGAVIPNAQITVIDGAGITKQATTSNGQFTITGVPGTWQYTVSAAGFVTKTGTWVIVSGSNSQVVNLQVENGVVLVTVKNAAGTIVIPSAQITVIDSAGITKQATTDSNGQVVITGLSGTWQYTVSASNYVTKTGTWAIAASPASNSQIVNLEAADSCSTDRVPTTPSIPYGSTFGSSGISYCYTTSANDPDVGDQVKYTFNFGGEITTTSFVNPGMVVSVCHSWSSTGTFYVYVQATDKCGKSTDWSNPLAVTITGQGNMAASVLVTVKNQWSLDAIPNAQINAKDGAGNIIPTATTNSNGQATVTGIPGNWVIIVSATGYSTVTDYWPAPSGSSSTLNYLTPAAKSAQATMPQTDATTTVPQAEATTATAPQTEVTTAIGAGNTKQATTNGAGQATITGIPGTWQGSSATIPFTVKSIWSGQLIPNALITVQDGAGNTKQVTTDGAGQATITGIPGTWQYSVSESGYVTSTGTSQVAAPPSSTSISVNLNPVGVSSSLKNSAQVTAPQTEATTTAAPQTEATTTAAPQAEATTTAAPQAEATTTTGPRTVQASVHITVQKAGAAGKSVIPNALINVQDGAGNTKQATTNGAGQATITGMSGTWQYSVSASGYVADTGTWQIAPSHARNNEVVHLQEVSLSPEHSAQTIMPQAETNTAAPQTETNTAAASQEGVK